MGPASGLGCAVRLGGQPRGWCRDDGLERREKRGQRGPDSCWVPLADLPFCIRLHALPLGLLQLASTNVTRDKLAQSTYRLIDGASRARSGGWVVSSCQLANVQVGRGRVAIAAHTQHESNADSSQTGVVYQHSMVLPVLGHSAVQGAARSTGAY